ncbi:type VI secretion system baseplate subunit TssK [Myxococcus landrumensis]|uniref:Type VI secretion system baseplate subunit TssK n=1 Tax=Myxococcus landrumensis TaxID=2813577 RepID=A0ABX7NCD9_9BACT|nr:type VI secretion system baseplate subunit TssK [Myxococcus landrumus]QSQ16455.1 type VI secretion system baseplate subunit TssK [Myxococcus landrumus]
MPSFKLARVRWHVGQTLLPEHFEAQEAALEAEVRLHASLSGTPGFGVAAMAWSEPLLVGGSLSISTLTAVTPAGFVVDVPGNAVLPPFSLEGTGRAEVTVYLHVMGDTTSAEGVRLYTEDPPMLERVLRRLRLSAEPVLDGAIDTLPLALFHRDTEGLWMLAEELVPPLLLVGPHPFLGALLSRLDSLLEQARLQLIARLSDSYLRTDRLTNARRALCEVQRLQAMRSDMQRHISPHPYAFFDALRSLYFEACCYLELMPDRNLPAYQHDAPGKGFLRWLELLTRALQPEATRVTHRSFEPRDGQFIFAPLPPEVLESGELYLLVQRRQAGEPLPVDGVKLAGPSRLATVRRMALKGIPFNHVPHPSFPHALGPEIDWYQLVQGEEWQFALRENGLAFYTTPALQGAQVSLFWRRA